MTVFAGSDARPHRLVAASAGTGKTYRLTLRYLELMLAGASPDHILATTFTRKAAGEILDRLLDRLATAVLDDGAAEALGSELSLPLDRGLAATLLESVCSRLGRLQVQTLDAFFHRLASLFRYELGLTSLQRVGAIGDPAVEPVRRRALEQMIDDLGAEEVETLVELLSRLYRGDAQRSILRGLDRIIVELHDLYRESPAPAVWSGLEIPGGLLGVEELAAVAEAITDAVGRSPDRRLLRAVRSDLAQALRGDWLGLVGSGVAKALLEGGAPTYYGRPLPDALVAAYQPLVEHARHVLVSRIAEQTAATHRVLEVFERNFLALRRRAGIVLYGELARGMEGLLRGAELEPTGGIDPPEPAIALLDLFYRLDSFIQHVLLDELQDTSLEQWRALAPLLEEILAYGDGTRTLFCVGDPKQSIYGWRGGCPELFDELRDRFAAGAGSVERLELSYRSSPVVLDAVDRVFSVLGEGPLAEEDSHRVAAQRWSSHFEGQRAAFDGQPGLVRLETSRCWEGLFPPDDEPPSTILDEDEVPTDDGGDPCAAPAVGPGAHLDHVASRVASIAARTASVPGASSPTIGVLVLTNRTVRELLDRLRQLGVEAGGEGQGGIRDDPAAGCILAALRLAGRPASTADAYQVARSPLGPVVGGVDWRCPERDSLRLRERIDREGASTTIARWIRGLGEVCDERNVERLQQLLELVVAIEPERLGPLELAQRLAASPVEEPNPARIRVMTVHQAKGLEFDAVVLGELEREIGALNNPLLEAERAGPTVPIDALYRSTNVTTRMLSDQLQVARRQEIERRVGDDLGVLYVAMTRARSELHLIVQPATGGGRSARRTFAALIRYGLLGGEVDATALARVPETVLFEAGAPVLGPAAERALVESAEAEAATSSDRRAPDTPSVEGVPQVPVVRPSSRVGSGLVDVGDLLRLDADTAKVRGQVMHAWLACIDWLRPGEQPEVEAGVARRVVPSLDDGSIELWREELRRGLASEAVGALFRRVDTGSRRPTPIVWREQPFYVVHEGRAIRGVFDRVVVHRRDGAPIGAELFEWKTDRLPDSSAIEQALRRYRGQIESYVEALGAILGVLPTAIRAAIVFVDSGEVRWLD